MDVPFPTYFAVGLPQGIRVEPKEGSVIGGVITRGGERVNIDPVSYALWLLLQLTFSEKQLQEKFKAQMGVDGFDKAMATLVSKRLVQRLGSKKDLKVFSTIRVIPKATGVGNGDKMQPLRYSVRPNFGDKEVVMNPFDYTVWTMWDGKLTVMRSWRAAAKIYNLRLSSVLQRQVGILFLLMSQGLLNLDFV
jgi:hypothetical protein